MLANATFAAETFADESGPSGVATPTAYWWPTGATTTLAFASVARELPWPYTAVQTFYPQAWRASAQSAVALATQSGVLPPTPQAIETFLPEAWSTSAGTRVAMRTTGGVLPPVPQVFYDPTTSEFPRTPTVRVTLGATSAVIALWPEPIPLANPLGATRKPLLLAGGSTSASYWPGKPPRTN